jgi:protein-disulfide isomerase
MHDLLYEHQGDLAERSLLRYAEQAGADAAEVANALQRGATRRRVEEDLEGGIRSGVNGTPTFFVNGVRYDASWAFEPFREHLQALLEGKFDTDLESDATWVDDRIASRAQPSRILN